MPGPKKRAPPLHLPLVCMCTTKHHPNQSHLERCEFGLGCLGTTTYGRFSLEDQDGVLSIAEPANLLRRARIVYLMLP